MAKRSVLVTRGSESHLMVPQANTWVSTSAGLTNRRPGISGMTAAPYGQILEVPHLLSDSAFDREAFHARCAKEAGDTRAVREYVLDVFGFCDGAAMAEHQNFGINSDCRFANRLNPGGGLIERHAGGGADRSLGSQSHVRDDKVRPGCCHGACVLLV